MLLRRITQHVKDQNWFAVFLDFLIVVAGILIAFQITNWNEGRVTAEREREVLIEVLGDIKNDRLELDAGIKMAELNIDASNYALELAGLDSVQKITMPIEDIPALSGFKFDIPSPRKMTPDQTKRLWGLATVRLHPSQAKSAFEALVSAGDLSLIQDTELVSELQKYNQQWASLENSQNRSYRPFRDHAIYTGQEFGLSPFTEMDEVEYAALLSSNPKLESALRTVLEYGVLHKNQTELVDSLAAALITRLESEITP